MKNLIKAIVNCLPGAMPYRVLDWTRRLRYAAVRRQQRFERDLRSRVGDPETVLQGPFAGMRYKPIGYFGGLLPKLLGTYELELTEALARLCRFGARVIVDIGAAEGFYATGLAIRNPDAQVIAYEISRPARTLIRRMARSNGVYDRVTVKGKCTVGALRRDLAAVPYAAVLCDCEGEEDLLIDPEAVPALSRSFVLVEVHDAYSPGVAVRLKERFKVTHNIDVIVSRPRKLDDLPCGLELSEHQVACATTEGRESAEWLLFEPKVRVL